MTYNCRSSNGRVDIEGPNIATRFSMMDKIPVNDCTSFRDALNGNWNDTTLSLSFFCEKNIEILQNGIRAGVYKKSNGQYVIGPQDCDSLKIIMRSVFLQYSANQPNNISEQITQLNKIVLEYCIQQVYSEAQGYMTYVNDVSTLVVPIERPVMTSNNDRQLELKSWF